jgi:hypothetical protein
MQNFRKQDLTEGRLACLAGARQDDDKLMFQAGGDNFKDGAFYGFHEGLLSLLLQIYNVKLQCK